MIEDPLNSKIPMVEGWKRRGYCNNCGWCCQFMGYSELHMIPKPEPGMTKIDDAYYEARGFERSDKDVSIKVSLHAPCQYHVTDPSTGKPVGCVIQETKPYTCKMFPFRPEQIEDTPCSYWFERELNGVRERKGGNESEIYNGEKEP